MRLKLRTKIAGGFLCIFLLAAMLGIYSIVSINRLDNMNEELALITDLNDTIKTFVEAHHVWGSSLSLALVHNDRSMFTGGFNPYACGYGQWKQGDGPYLIDDAQVRQLVAAIYQPHFDLHTHGATAVGLWEEGRMDEAMEIFTTIVFPAVRQSTDNMTQLSARYEYLRDILLEDIYSLVDTVLVVISVMFAVAFIAFIALSFTITKSILTPVNRLVTVVSDVTAGKLEINRIDTNTMADDEIGRLTQDMYSLVDTVGGMVADLTESYNQYIKIGNMQYQIDANKYQNSYKEMIELVNNLLEAVTTDILSVADTLVSVSDGDFDTVMDSSAWVGEWVVMPNAIDKMQGNLQSVNKEINAVIEAAAIKGDLNFQIDASGYKGNWKTIMDGLNKIVKAVDEPLKVIGISMEEMKMGNFNVAAIEKKISGMGLSASSSDYAGSFGQIISNMESTVEATAAYIKIISDDLKSIASGDLTTVITQDFVGDYIAIKESLNNISTSLNKTMSEIRSASEQVLSGAKQISASAMDLANGASTQASSVQELNASVDLINQQTRQNAENAVQANTLSQTSTDNAREGNTAMTQTLDAMNQIKDSSNNISKIIRTIQDIAFQTNLLALNAAVEAARAGEHGKGFAVVAEEVRSLAARSQSAASETTELIGTSISTVDSGSEIAQSTAETLNTIVDNANKVLSIVSNISTSSQEQAEAISQVVTGLQQISQVVQSNSAVSEEAAASAEELTSQAELLQQLVSFFKL